MTTLPSRVSGFCQICGADTTAPPQTSSSIPVGLICDPCLAAWKTDDPDSLEAAIRDLEKDSDASR